MLKFGIGAALLLISTLCAVADDVIITIKKSPPAQKEVVFAPAPQPVMWQMVPVQQEPQVLNLRTGYYIQAGPPVTYYQGVGYSQMPPNIKGLPQGAAKYQTYGIFGLAGNTTTYPDGTQVRRGPFGRVLSAN